MTNTTIYIKNMVCQRCIMVVNDLLVRLGFTPVHVELGKAVVQEPLTEADKACLAEALETVGFEWIDDRRKRLIEQIKQEIIALVHRQDSALKVNLSDFLADRCRHDYSYLSKLFSEACGITVEKYYILQKIERVKELLVYDELSLASIAELLNYSSSAHLCRQFKQVTGITPTRFRLEKGVARKPLDKII